MWANELDLCRKCCARQERTHPRGLRRAGARSCGEDVGFVSGNEECARTVPHLHGFSFSAAVGTWLWNCTFSESSQPKSKSPEEVYEQDAYEKRHCSDCGIGRCLCVTPCIRAARWDAGTEKPARHQSNVRCAAAVVYAARQ